MAKKSVLVLNAGLEPLHHVTPQHAVRMIFRGVAVPYEEDDTRTFGPFKLPRQMVLTRYIPLNWYYSAPLVWSKSGVLRRDNYTCAYCGKKGAGMTVDHVIPVSRGGKSDWKNCVCSCFKCNNRKDNQTPEEAGMKLLFQPVMPRREDLVMNGRNQ